jgi:uncharacterized protein YecT (DUF1311 family)
VRIVVGLAVASLLTAGQFAFAQEAGEAVCAKYGDTDLPAEASVSMPTQSPGCESYKSYAGIGRPVDYKAARDCAWQERAAQLADLGQNEKAPIAWVVGGSLILTDLYANGLGVSKNLPLAMRLACEAKDSFVSEAVTDLEVRSTDTKKAAEQYELCDYAATTFEMNFCAEFSRQAKDARRDNVFLRLSKGWTTEQTTAFASAKTAFNDYALDVARHETYRGGTIRNIRMSGVEESLHAKFLEDLLRFEKGEMPSGPVSLQVADKQLNLVYAKTIAASKKPQEHPDEVVQASEIQTTERSWLKYRDSWVSFAKLRYPSTTADLWLAWLTSQRTKQLTLVLCGFTSSDALCTKAILDELSDDD